MRDKIVACSELDLEQALADYRLHSLLDAFLFFVSCRECDARNARDCDGTHQVRKIWQVLAKMNSLLLLSLPHERALYVDDSCCCVYNIARSDFDPTNNAGYQQQTSF